MCFTKSFCHLFYVFDVGAWGQTLITCSKPCLSGKYSELDLLRISSSLGYDGRSLELCIDEKGCAILMYERCVLDSAVAALLVLKYSVSKHQGIPQFFL